MFPPQRIVCLTEETVETLYLLGEEDRIAAGLATLHDEDPAFQFHVDAELHQTIIRGLGELHLEVQMEP